ncbi:hypothetical protein QQ045_006708 [Rhodiola kirilowii]
MGCRHSKQAVVVESPTFEFSVAIGSSGSLVLDSSLKNPSRFRDKGKAGEEKSIEPSKLSSRSSSARFSVSFRLGSLRRCVEAEQAAAGWPTWLTAVASEAIHGMVPLPADNFVKMAKVCLKLEMTTFWLVFLHFSACEYTDKWTFVFGCPTW